MSKHPGTDKTEALGRRKNLNKDVNIDVLIYMQIYIYIGT